MVDIVCRGQSAGIVPGLRDASPQGMTGVVASDSGDERGPMLSWPYVLDQKSECHACLRGFYANLSENG